MSLNNEHVFAVIDKLLKEANRNFQLHEKHGDKSGFCSYFDGQRDVLKKLKQRLGKRPKNTNNDNDLKIVE